jgi:nitroreductase/NAD-dependent dihydropyrimidine dehydrogenase PreA subunit
MINLDRDACTDCLECRSVCPNYVFGVTSKPGSEQELHLRYPEQCCACGHCIAVCPSDALSHPELPLDEFVPLAMPDVGPEAMQTLLFSRRSIRHYKPDPVPDDMVERLLLAATHAGTSSNGQTEGFVVIRDRAFLRNLELLVVDVLWRAGFRHLGSKGLVSRLLEMKFGAELVRQYRPYHGIFKHRRENGELEGVIFRDAPVVILAHGLKANQLAGINCALAMRNVELLALTMGLGSCWIGFLVAAAARSKRIRDFIGIARDWRVFGALMVGYPNERFNLGLPRKARPTRWI